MSTNLTNKLSLPESWTEDLNKKLKEPTINNEFDEWKFEKNFGKEIDIFALSFNAEAKARFQVFNDETDEDKPQKLIPNPYPAIGDDKAMIRYDLEAKLKASAGINFNNLGFNFDTSQKLKTSYYSIHSNEKTLQKAASEDLTNFRFIFSVEDVKSLKTNECLAVSYFGEIGAKLELSYNDAFTGVISEIAKKLPISNGLKIKCNTGASLSFNVRIKDKFYSLIRKYNEDSYEIKINKISSSEKGMVAKAGIEVQIEDNKNLKAFQNELLDAVFERPLEQVDDLVQNQLDNLNDDQLELLTFVGEQIGMNIDFSQPEVIKEEYNNLKDKLLTKVIKVLEGKLGISFSFEYKNISESNTFFEGIATTVGLEKNLRHIVMFKPSALENADGIKVTKYMLIKTTTITNKVGFALSFGDFKLAWEKLKTVKEESVKDKIKNTNDISVSFIRKHSYKGINDRNWAIAVNAEMDASVKTPHMNDFNFDLTLHWEDRQKKTDADELTEFVNMATIWNCIPESEFDNTLNEIREAILNLRNVKFSCHLNVPKGEMDRLFGALANANSVLIANTLAESMPYANYAFRKSPSIRRIAYNSIWQKYLETEPVGSEVRNFANYCQKYIVQDQHLASWEAQYNSGPMTRDNGAVSFVGLIEFFSVYQIIDNVKSGAGNLDRLLEKNKPYNLKKIMENVDKIDDVFKFKGANDVYFHLNFMARYILNVATELGMQDLIETVASVEYSHGNSTKKLIYSM